MFIFLQNVKILDEFCFETLDDVDHFPVKESPLEFDEEIQ